MKCSPQKKGFGKSKLMISVQLIRVEKYVFGVKHVICFYQQLILNQKFWFGKKAEICRSSFFTCLRGEKAWLQWLNTTHWLLMREYVGWLQMILNFGFWSKFKFYLQIYHHYCVVSQIMQWCFVQSTATLVMHCIAFLICLLWPFVYR